MGLSVLNHLMDLMNQFKKYTTGLAEFLDGSVQYEHWSEWCECCQKEDSKDPHLGTVQWIYRWRKVNCDPTLRDQRSTDDESQRNFWLKNSISPSWIIVAGTSMELTLNISEDPLKLPLLMFNKNPNLLGSFLSWVFNGVVREFMGCGDSRSFVAPAL